jgi:hypothetical protein
MTKKHIRIIYWSLFSLFMFFIVLPLFYFFYLFDEVKVRKNIEDQFNNNDYQIIIKGAVLPKLWHGLSLGINDIVLVNKKNFQDKIYIKNFSCNMSWLYLIIAQYKIVRVSISSVILDQTDLTNFKINEVINFEDTSKLFFHSVDYFQVDNIILNAHGKVILKDGVLKIKQHDNHSDFIFFAKLYEDYNLKIYGKSKIDTRNIDLSKININVFNKNLQINFHVDSVLNLDTNSLSLSNLIGNIIFKKYKINFNIGSSYLENNTLQISNANLFIDNKNQNEHALLSIDNVIINLLDYNFKVNSLIGQYNLDLHNQKIISNFNVQNLFKESSNIYSKCSVQSSINLNDIFSIPISSMFNGDCDYLNNNFIFNLTGSINNSNSKINIVYRNDNNLPIINMKLMMENFKLFSSKSVDYLIKNIKNYFNKFKNKKYLTNLDLNIQNLVYDNINFKNVSSEIKLKPNELNMTRFKGNLYDGKLLANLRINYVNNLFNIYLNQDFINLKFESLLSDLFAIKNISGDARVKSYLTFNNLSNLESISNHMNGYIEINAKHGIFKGIDLNNLYSNNILSPLTSKSTIFDNLVASFNFVNGVSNSKIRFNSLVMSAIGSGQFNIINQNIAYKFDLHTKLPQNDKHISGVILPFSVNGYIQHPKLKIESIILIKEKKVGVVKKY